METLYCKHEQEEYEESYWRNRINDEAGVNIRTADEIFELFDETINEVKNPFSDRYYMDEFFEYIDKEEPTDSYLEFTVKNNDEIVEKAGCRYHNGNGYE